MGCISSHPVFRSQCDLNFYLSQPYYSASTCINNVIKRDIVFKTEFCGIRVGNLDWMEKRTLQVYGYNDGMYNTNNRYAYIRLSTSSKYISTQNNIWRDVHISQIRVIKNINHLLFIKPCYFFSHKFTESINSFFKVNVILLP